MPIAPTPWQGRPGRRLGWGALVAVVTLVHVGLGVTVVADLIGWDAAAPPLRRIDVDLVSELMPTDAPLGGAAMAPPQAPRSTRAPTPRTPAASAPRPAASTPAQLAAAAAAAAAADAAASAAAQAQAAAMDSPASADIAASAASADSAAAALASAAASAPADAPPAPTAPAPPTPAPSAPPSAVAANPPASAPVAGPPTPTLEWPPSTRLAYTVTGRFKGNPSYGTADVEWRRDGAHYQVEFNVHIDFAGTVHMLSDGTIGERGLMPERFDAEAKWALGGLQLRKDTIHFRADGVQLSNGTVAERLPDMQDQASQFVQFVWMFSVHPELLQPGRPIEMNLALPRRAGRWLYDPQPPEKVLLPFGALDAVHLKPRAESRRGREATVEIWSAPNLRYLPIKLLLVVDDENQAEITLKSRPLQAALPASRPASAPASAAAAAPSR